MGRTLIFNLLFFITCISLVEVIRGLQCRVNHDHHTQEGFQDVVRACMSSDLQDQPRRQHSTNWQDRRPQWSWSQGVPRFSTRDNQGEGDSDEGYGGYNVKNDEEAARDQGGGGSGSGALGHNNKDRGAKGGRAGSYNRGQEGSGSGVGSYSNRDKGGSGSRVGSYGKRDQGDGGSRVRSYNTREQGDGGSGYSSTGQGGGGSGGGGIWDSKDQGIIGGLGNRGSRSRRAAQTHTNQRRFQDHGLDKNYNHTDTNKDDSSTLRDIEPCAIHCIFQKMKMLDKDNQPDKAAVLNVMTSKIQDPELRNFLREAVSECIEALESDYQSTKCSASKSFAMCMEEKGQQNCEDWDDEVKKPPQLMVEGYNLNKHNNNNNNNGHNNRG